MEKKTSKKNRTTATLESARAASAAPLRVDEAENGKSPKLTEYEERVLAATPRKALVFLNAASTKVDIRALLFRAGYSQQEHDLGWAILRKATGYVPTVASVADDEAARAAVSELDEWDEPGFRRVSSALERFHPEQHAFVFAGLEPAQGPGAVLSVQTLLDRVDDLDSGVRSDSVEQDKAAIATLAARGIDSNLRTYLRARIEVAKTLALPEFPPAPVSTERADALLELRVWYKDWSQTARAVITRKDYLIMLGLSKRRRNREELDEVADNELPGPIPPTASVASASTAVTREGSASNGAAVAR